MISHLSQRQASVVGENDFLLPPDRAGRLVLVGRRARGRGRPDAAVRVGSDDQTRFPGLGRRALRLPVLAGRRIGGRPRGVQAAHRHRRHVLLVRHHQPEVLVQHQLGGGLGGGVAGREQRRAVRHHHVAALGSHVGGGRTSAVVPGRKKQRPRPHI